MKKRVVELFAGVGGFRVGLNDISGFDESGRAIEKKDWQFVWANQWEPSTVAQHAYDCYVTRFGENKNHSNEDIALVNKENIPDHELLVAGFPCQDYSVARTKSGEKGIEGKKGVLFWEIVDVLEEKKTPFFLLENVDRLLRSPAKQRGRDFGIMLRVLSDLGYNLEWRVINAADYGNAQRRRRVFIFGWKRHLDKSDINPSDLIFNDGLFATAFPIQNNKKELKRVDIGSDSFNDTVDMTQRFSENFSNSGVLIGAQVYHIKTEPIKERPIPLKEILLKTEQPERYLSKKQDEKMKYLKGGKKIKRVSQTGHEYYYSEGNMSYPEDVELPGRTMLTSEGTMNRSTHIVPDAVTNKNRKLHPIEAERLQGFPDNWTNTGMSDSRRFFMMGNALVTNIVNRLEPFLDKKIREL